MMAGEQETIMLDECVWPRPGMARLVAPSAIKHFNLDACAQVRLRPDFDRGCYNLGTVLYTYACAVQAELTNQLKGDPRHGWRW